MKTDRLANVVLYLLRGSPKAGLTQLLKRIYFADFYHYRDHLATITGMTYVAQKRGPVIKDYDLRLAELTTAGFISCRKVPVVGHPDKPKHQYEALAEPDPRAFSPDERATLDEVLLRFGSKSGTEMSEMTHEELTPWKLVWDEKAPGATIPHALFRWLDNYADTRDVETARKRTKQRLAAASGSR